MANRFKKLFKIDSRDFSKNKYVRKPYPKYKRKNDSFKEPPICYEYKVRGHIAEDCNNRKNKKYKLKGKVMVVTWDDDSNESKQ